MRSRTVFGFALALLVVASGAPSGSVVAARPPSALSGLTLEAPFEKCDTKGTHKESPTAGDRKILKKGFSVATSSCDASAGTISYRPVVFGGSEGGVTTFSEPTQTADVTGYVQARFRAPVPGDWRVSVVVHVGGKAGAAAGSGIAASIDIPDEIGKSLVDFIADAPLTKFLDVLKALLDPTAAGSSTRAFLDVTGAGEGSATEQLPGVAASFPVVGPWSSRDYDQAIELTTTIHVSRPGVVRVRVGVASHAEAWGWAAAFAKVTADVERIEVVAPDADPPPAPSGLKETWSDWAICTGGPDWTGAPTALSADDRCYTASYQWDPVAEADRYRIYGAFMEPGIYSCNNLDFQPVASLPASSTSIDLYVDGERGLGLVCFYISAENAVGESDIVQLPRRPSS